MNRKLFDLIPGMEDEEFIYLSKLTEELDEDELELFASIYNGKRQKADTVLIGAVIGLLGIAGIHRFMLDQIGLGILYLLTGGLCLIGTIVDLINYKGLTQNYNEQKATQALSMTKRMSS